MWKLFSRSPESSKPASEQELEAATVAAQSLYIFIRAGGKINDTTWRTSYVDGVATVERKLRVSRRDERLIRIHLVETADGMSLRRQELITGDDFTSHGAVVSNSSFPLSPNTPIETRTDVDEPNGLVTHAATEQPQMSSNFCRNLTQSMNTLLGAIVLPGMANHA